MTKTHKQRHTEKTRWSDNANTCNLHLQKETKKREKKEEKKYMIVSQST